jgi:hypothetical protein
MGMAWVNALPPLLLPVEVELKPPPIHMDPFGVGGVIRPAFLSFRQ